MSNRRFDSHQPYQISYVTAVDNRKLYLVLVIVDSRRSWLMVEVLLDPVLLLFTTQISQYANVVVQCGIERGGELDRQK